ncbi:sensor histidine kinase [Limnospira platensis]|uniref:sensor histidine kinase n=1 Tax=Limnospira platensis TaxID=118562 RepID=UPI003D6DDC86
MLHNNSDLPLSGFGDILPGLDADLVFIQNQSGEYLLFSWRQCDRHPLPVDQITGTNMADTFKPLVLTPYQERIDRVIASLIPERFSYPFCYEEYYFPLELIVSPILKSNGSATHVLVMGRLLENSQLNLSPNHSELIAYRALPSNFDIQQKMLVQIAGTLCRSVPPTSQIYQTILGQITQKIRRTLDLKEIWQQTVNSLGQVLGVSRCIICPYRSTSDKSTQVVAEYRQEDIPMMLGLNLSSDSELGWAQALATLEPIIIERSAPENDPYQRHSLMVIPTAYQEQPNSLISLHQCDRTRQWTAAEIDFVRELATHVGTVIAHATLYQELEEARLEAVALSRLKSEFLANTSHELRTPLNGMIGFLQLVLDGMADDPEEEREFIEEAHQAAIHLLNLINDVLDIAKIEAGKMDIELALVKVDEVLREIEHFIRPQVEQKNLKLTIQTGAGNSQIIVYGNYQRILQVMLNLVGNSIKFTHKGGINISLGIIRENVIIQNQQFPGFVEFRVVDTGIGVPIEKQDRLFQAFSQVDSGYTKQYGGTGLGLVISQKLVQAMGGKVKFYSLGEGLGSTVTFTIPLYQEP